MRYKFYVHWEMGKEITIEAENENQAWGMLGEQVLDLDVGDAEEVGDRRAILVSYNGREEGNNH